MTYPEWIIEQLAFYEQELAQLEQECERDSDFYHRRKADIEACLKMLRELAEPPIEQDST